MNAIKISREELYRLVWLKSASSLATEFGCSDAWIGKLCRKLKVPRPSRGYWARLAAGQKMKKIPLPQLPRDQLLKEALKEIPASFKEESELILSIKPLDILPLPKYRKNLGPIAEYLSQKLSAAEVSQEFDGRVKISYDGTIPDILISKAVISRLVVSFHAILKELQRRGVSLVPARSKFLSIPKFVCASDELSIKIEEPIVHLKREPTEMEKRYPSWEWNLSWKEYSGCFTYLLEESRYCGRKRNIVVQQKNETDGQFGARVVEAIWAYFMRLRRERIEANEKAISDKKEALLAQKQERRERIEKAKVARRKAHKEKLMSLERAREQNLFFAAHYWGIAHISEIIEIAEQKWKALNSELSGPQKEWLNWAKRFAAGLKNPEIGYPDPELDGGFNLESIVSSVSYPKVRKIRPHPALPAMPKSPKSDPLPQERKSDFTYHRDPYPFWLKHQH